VSEDQTNWDEWIPHAVYVYNTTVHTATTFTLFELVYGFKTEVPSALKEAPTVQYNYDDNVMELKGGCNRPTRLLGKSYYLARKRAKSTMIKILKRPMYK
jgi:hypothetical protein